MSPIFDTGLYVGSTAASKVYLGATEVWSSGPPADPFFSNVKVLIRANGTQGQTTFTDLSSSSNSITTQGSAIVDTNTVKFGTGSLSTTVGGSRLTVPAGSLGVIDYTTPLTIEFFAFIPTINTNQYALEFYENSAGQTIRIQFINTNRYDVILKGAQKTSGTNAVPVNQWIHFAVTWDNSLVRIFINGVQNATATRTNQGSIGATETLALGGRVNGGNSLLGYMDEIRITIGTARYTSNFTPPTAEFANY